VNLVKLAKIAISPVLGKGLVLPQQPADSTDILGQPGYIQAKHALTTHSDRPGVCPRAPQ
jgi:hypothetical protein